MQKDKVIVKWLFNATPSSVWNAWTNPVAMKLWFGSDPNGVGISAKVNLQEEGEYEVTFQNSDGSEYTCYGKYMKIIPTKRLDFTWIWKNNPKKVEFISITFKEKENDTEMLFEHRDIDQETSHDYENGWKRTFGKLEKLLASRT